MWTYPELKYLYVNQNKVSGSQLAEDVNRIFHDGLEARNASDVEKILRSRTIFNKDKPY